MQDMPHVVIDGSVVPHEAVVISIAFFAMIAIIIVGWPLARALARRLERKQGASETPETRARLERIEHAIEAVAIEVERISEGQRYTTRLLSEGGLAERLAEVSRRLPERAP
jgi:hypothetical protein